MSKNLLVALAGFAALTSLLRGSEQRLPLAPFVLVSLLRKPLGESFGIIFRAGLDRSLSSDDLAAWNVWRVGGGWDGASTAITVFPGTARAERCLVSNLLGLRSPGSRPR